MPDSASGRRLTASRFKTDEEQSIGEAPTAASWLAVVGEKVKSIRYGVVQIVIHDSKVVQIERTERTRFDVPQGVADREIGKRAE